jgi:hypothetical protein
VTLLTRQVIAVRSLPIASIVVNPYIVPWGDGLSLNSLELERKPTK